MRPQYTNLVLFLLLILGISVFNSNPAQAETRYVKPSADVVVRRGQGNKYKIIAMAKEGTAVQFLEEGNGYSRIRLPNGKEGWILKRFLSSHPPLKEVVATLRTENAGLLENQTALNQRIDALETALTISEQQRDLALQDRDKIQSQYQQLQQDTADVVQIKTDMHETSAKNRGLMQDLATVRQDNNSLRSDYSLKWFLAGGGVLLFGMIMGGLLRGSGKRKPSLL